MDPLLTATIFAALHVIGIAAALAGIGLRATALWGEHPDLPRALSADNLWGLASILVIGSGLVRLLLTEKGWPFYAGNAMFHLKMGLFGVVGCLEFWPMFVLLRHRIQGTELSRSTCNRIGQISALQFALLLAMPFAAAAMARGLAY